MEFSQNSSLSDQRGVENDESNSNQELFSKMNITYLIINCCLGSFVIGYALAASNISFSVILEHTSQQTKDEIIFCSLLSSMVPIGGALGSLFLVSYMFELSRRFNLIAADILTIIGASICMPQGSNLTLYGMFLLGLSVGINTIMIPTYLIEYAPSYSGKGRVMITHQFFIALGITSSYIWGLFIKRDETDGRDGDTQQYQDIIDSKYFQIAIFAIPLALAILRALTLLFVYTKETPFFYFINSKKIKANNVINQYYSEEEAERLLEFFQVKYARQIEGSTSLFDMLRLRYRRRAGIGCLMNFTCYFSGVFFILLYSKESMDSIRSEDANQIRTLVIGGALLLAQIFQLYVSKFLGRKTILMIGQSLYIIGFVGLTLCHYIQQDQELNTMTVFECIVCVGFSFQSTVIHIIMNEILPERGVAASHFVSFFSILIGALIYPFLLDQQLYLFATLAAFSSFAFILLYYFIKETQGLTNYQIEKLYTNNFHGLVKDIENSPSFDISVNHYPSFIS